jgi:Carboxypeptidase regulatory-like domain
MRLIRFVLAVFLLSISPSLFSQSASTSLRGVVTDASGAVLPTAIVTITNKSVGFTATAKVDSHGEYAFQQLSPGKYTISIEATGFGRKSVTAELLVAQPATINAQLGVSTQTVEVDVSGATETINTTDATIGNAINNETIMQLPSEARNPQTLLSLQPGVLFIGKGNDLGNADALDSRNGAVSGARPDQTNITLDGVDNNDQVIPSAFTGVLRVTLDSTEEFRVTTSDANADTGRSSGGQVNLVTRSGTNQVHGAFYEYNRSSIGIANDWFLKQGQLSSGEANRPGKLIRNTYGVRVGGPILKNKLFLFGNYEGNRQNEAVAVIRTVPSDSLRAGTVRYTGDDGSIVTLNASQIASMDPVCTTTCPQGRGIDPAALALFQTYPHANGSIGVADNLNTGSFTFSSPVPITQNVYVARMDFNPSDKHRFYVRGSIQNDQQAKNSYYPGQPPYVKLTDDSRGISGNYTWVVSPSMVNNLRYGFINQSFASTGAGNGNYATFRTLDPPESMQRSSSTLVPSHNLIDDVNWSKGKHTLQFGVNYRTFDYQNANSANSFTNIVANSSWMFNSGFANTGSSFDPAAFGFTPVDPGSQKNYDYAISMLAGLINNETANFNYELSKDGKTGTALAAGSPVSRSFRSNEVEWYAQDSWKPIPNLTITAGIRHTILQTPYETNGQQIQPTIDIHQWFETRGAQAAIGNSVQPEFTFTPAGQARGGKPFYPMNWKNFAPRFAIAFAPAPEEGSWIHKLFGGAGRSSIRAGFGIYYDHFGQGLVANYSRLGSFGLSTSLNNPASSLTADTTPRYTGLHNIPNLISNPPTTVTYPQTPSDDPNTTGFTITNGLDDHITTPYSEVFNLSIQRELKGGFTFEASYVGRLGRHLLQDLDLAQPLNLVDPKSGMDYYTAATLLSKAYDQGATNVATIPYWENLFPDAIGAAGGNGTAGASATQNIYDDLWQPGGVRGNETAALYDMDIFCYPGCGGKIGRYWPLQYSSLYATSSMGTSSYNAGQFVLRHPMVHGIQIDLSYTYSRSLDLGSDTESNPANTTGTFGPIIDAFNPRKSYGLSDFNTTHLLTADWVLKLPVGRGQALAGGSSRLLDSLIGGWNLSGIARLSSGLPFGISDGLGWGTNWEYESNMVQTGPIKMRKHIDANGSPQAFDDPKVAAANLRAPYPGEVGNRNNFIGDGYFDIDAGLHKSVHFGDRYNLHFAWEVFDVTNSVRFDSHNIESDSTSGSQLGVYGGILAPPGQTARRMQLSGRFEF